MRNASTLDFAVAGADWPNRDASRFVSAGGQRWHVQMMGQGPILLLIHGTAASTHSWRDLMAPLARHFTVVAPDLPSHGFTSAPPNRQLSLAGMASLLTGLLAALGVKPMLAVGHSAGAAVLVRMTIDGQIAPAGLVSINGALLPFPGIAGHIFPAMAKLIYLNPLTPRLFSSAATPAKVARLIEDTGSRIDARGLDLYARLMAHPRHVAGALGMMANWDLHGLERDLPKLRAPLLVIAGECDRAVPPLEALKLKRMVPDSDVRIIPRLGHLAHEEQPDAILAEILSFARRHAIIEANPQRADDLRQHET